MQFNLEQWIDEVRQRPEHIRMRYVFICVAVSMALVVGVWLLSVTESFQTAATDMSGTAESVNTMLPKPGDLSLDQLLKGNETLGTEKQTISGEQFFEEEYQVKSAPRYEDEGIAPVPKTNEEP